MGESGRGRRPQSWAEGIDYKSHLAPASLGQVTPAMVRDATAWQIRTQGGDIRPGRINDEGQQTYRVTDRKGRTEEMTATQLVNHARLNRYYDESYAWITSPAGRKARAVELMSDMRDYFSGKGRYSSMVGPVETRPNLNPKMAKLASAELARYRRGDLGAPALPAPKSVGGKPQTPAQRDKQLQQHEDALHFWKRHGTNNGLDREELDALYGQKLNELAAARMANHEALRQTQIQKALGAEQARANKAAARQAASAKKTAAQGGAMDKATRAVYNQLRKEVDLRTANYALRTSYYKQSAATRVWRIVSDLEDAYKHGAVGDNTYRAGQALIHALETGRANGDVERYVRRSNAGDLLRLISEIQTRVVAPQNGAFNNIGSYLNTQIRLDPTTGERLPALPWSPNSPSL